MPKQVQLVHRNRQLRKMAGKPQYRSKNKINPEAGVLNARHVCDNATKLNGRDQVLHVLIGDGSSSSWAVSPASGGLASSSIAADKANKATTLSGV